MSPDTEATDPYASPTEDSSHRIASSDPSAFVHTWPLRSRARIEPGKLSSPYVSRSTRLPPTSKRLIWSLRPSADTVFGPRIVTPARLHVVANPAGLASATRMDWPGARMPAAERSNVPGTALSS